MKVSIFTLLSLALTLLFSGIAFLVVGCDDGSKSRHEASGTPDNEQAKSAADYLLTNGKVYTVDPQRPWAEAIAVKGNEIVFVGSTENAKELIGENTKVRGSPGPLG